MGFNDSIKGRGRLQQRGFFDTLGGLVTSGLEGLGGIIRDVAPTFLAGAAQKVFDLSGLPGPGFNIRPTPAPAGQLPVFAPSPGRFPARPPPRPITPASFGGPPMAVFPGGFETAGFDLPFFDVAPQGSLAASGGCPPLFQPNRVGVRPIPLIMVPNPVTGAPTFFKHAGRPILFSGDLRASKLVNRIARRARRKR